MIKYLFPLVMILCSINCARAVDLSNEILYNIRLDNKIITNDLRLIEEKDLVYFKEGNEPDLEKIYKANLKGYREKVLMTSYTFKIKNDSYIALACINKKNKDSVLIIVQKKGKDYFLKKHFIFKKALSFITGFGKNKLTLCFQLGSDWYKYIIWNGKDFVLEEVGE